MEIKSKLVDGFIPADKPCPFASICVMKETCKKVERPISEKQFSCALARAFDMGTRF